MNKYLNHFTAIRTRVRGSGNLNISLISYDDVYSQSLTPIAMVSLTNKTPTQLANFTQQTARIRIETNEIDEIFQISQILVYSKPVASSFPQ